MTGNIGRCPKCGKFLVAEEYPNHLCTGENHQLRNPLLGVRYIGIDHYFEKREENGDTILIARGLDGYFYRLTQCPHSPSHLSDVSYRPRRSDGDLTEPMLNKE